jgi:hypothetical protein
MANASRRLRGKLALACTSALAWASSQDRGRVLDGAMHHLGDDAKPEWGEAPSEPEPGPLAIAFDSQANAAEWTLEIAARDVDDGWELALNGRAFGRLQRGGGELRVGRYPVPPGSVRQGANTLTIRALDGGGDDITVGRVVLLERSLRAVARLGRLFVSVRAGPRLVPARLTLARADGAVPEIYYAERGHTAVRPGIVYTGDGEALLEVAEGRLRLWASRGMEWSVDAREVEVVYGETRELELVLAREVDTAGWVAADTHVHTLTHSGHGDASVEERLVTLAAEGIELAIATDHNHHTDYRPAQRELGLGPYFTPVVGNEVTTDNGHMNAFPLDPAGPVPDHELADWKALVAGIRARGAKVVILNHPRWPEDGEDPLAKFGFDERTGLNAAGQEFTFDCIEIVNSDAPTSPPEVVLPAWYALLERGLRLTAVGASDSHTVGVIVGQGRTYVPSASDDPARLDVDAACRAFLEGRVSVALGMFATIELEGAGMGDVLHTEAGELEALVRVRHPRWVTPRTLELVVNGRIAATAALDDGAAGDTPTAKTRRLRFERPRPDSWVVALAHGDPVREPFAAMSLPRTLALTNPVFLRP